MSTPILTSGSAAWVLLEVEVDGRPVVMKVVEELPPVAMRDRFGWLTVISWRYDASENNGMPPPAINDQMIQLENAIDGVQEDGLCVQVYSKTGTA